MPSLSSKPWIVRDVRMIQRCEHLRLALEAGKTIRIAGEALAEAP